MRFAGLLLAATAVLAAPPVKRPNLPVSFTTNELDSLAVTQVGGIGADRDLFF